MKGTGINPFTGGGGMARTSKGQYVLIASAINRTLKDYINAGNAVPSVFAAKIISNLGDACADDNPNFNRTVFYKACVAGIAEGTLLGECDGK